MASRWLICLAFLNVCASTLGHVVGTGPMDGVDMDFDEMGADSAVFQELAGSVKETCDTKVMAKTIMGCGQSGTVSVGKSSCKAFGTFKNYFGLDSGMVISTGHVNKLETKYVKGGDNGEEHQNGKSDEDLVTLTLTFHAKRKGFAALKYIFASQEMPAYFGSKFNDDAKILINGKSVGVLPNGKALNIKNAGGGGGPKDKKKWIKEFVLNANLKKKGVPKSIPGYIKLLTAFAPVKKGKNTLTVRIQDKADGAYNSMMFLKANSFCVKSKVPPISPAQAKAMGVKAPKKKRSRRGAPCKSVEKFKKAMDAQGAGWCPWNGWKEWS